MNGSVTYYYGRALTGQGEKQLYRELIDEADQVYFLVGAFGMHISKLLREIGYFFVKQGEDIEWFLDPLVDDVVEALYIPNTGQLFIHDKEGVPRPTLLGSRHHIVSFYHCYDEALLEAHGEQLDNLVKQGYVWREKLFSMLELAKHLHDEWELVNQKGVNWQGIDAERQLIEQKIFEAIQLTKEGFLTHRVLGTLTPNGPSDTLENITKVLEKRLFIKGYPGTGKSTLMKKLAVMAVERGLHVQLVWCGLDATSIDMVVLPELSFCIFDSTEPHVYQPDPHRPGDIIVDLSQYCQLSEEQEEAVAEIANSYKDAMARAKEFVQKYAEKVYEQRLIYDDAIAKGVWNEACQKLFEQVK